MICKNKLLLYYIFIIYFTEQDGVIQEIHLSAKAHDVWFNDKKWEDYPYLIWRYIATASGVLRVTPAITLSKGYDPAQRTW